MNVFKICPRRLYVYFHYIEQGRPDFMENTRAEKKNHPGDIGSATLLPDKMFRRSWF